MGSILELTVAASEPSSSDGSLPLTAPGINYGIRSVRSLTMSVALHAAIITALANVSFRVTPPPELLAERLLPTQVRIDNHLYYVHDLPVAQNTPPKLILPAQARKALAAEAPKPAETPREAVKRELARTFIPPEVRRTPTATQTLIQPLSPPDLVPPPTPLPNFRLMTAQPLIKAPKPFVAPGRKDPPPPPKLAEVTPPTMDLLHADPVPANLQPKLALTPPPSPPAPPPPPNQIPDGPATAPQGEPVNILSLSDRPVPLGDKLIVPQGNIAQESGNASAPASAAAANSSATVANNSTAAANANSAASTRTGSGLTVIGGTSGTATGGTPAGSPTGVAAGSSGSPSGIAAGGISTGVTTGRILPGQVIIRPANGNFDAVVVQTTPLDQYPESRGLLSGRPIYSVYVSVGAARDWTLFFCVPNERPAAQTSSVVQLGPPPAPVKAPFPTKLMRPAVTLPSFQKYILVHGIVDAQGHFEELKIVRPVLPDTDRALLSSLAGWEFRAATKDGVAIAVEFLLSIPAQGL